MAEEDKPASLREEMYFDSALIGLHNSNIHVILFRFRSGLSDFKFPSDTPGSCYSDTTSTASSASPLMPTSMIDDNIKIVSHDTQACQ